MELRDKIKNLIKNNWFDGIVLTLMGLFMLLWPTASLKILCIVVGIVLILLGAAKLIDYTKNQNTVSSSTLPLGIIQLVIGILLIVISRFFVSIFLIVAGLVLLYGCFLMFRKAYQMRTERGTAFYVSLIPAILILILAIVMIFNPVGTAAFIIQMTGVVAIIEGLTFLFSMREL